MILRAETEDEKAVLIEYLTIKIGASKANLVGDMPYDVYAVVRRGIAVGAILLTNFRGTSVELCFAGDPGWLSRRDLVTIMRHMFIERGIRRAYGTVMRSNGKSRELAKRLGCREIGILEDEFGAGRDGVLYSMAAKSCRWIKGRVRG